MLFSLKFQRDNRQNALSVAPTKGKTGEKGCIFTTLWDETATNHNKVYYFKYFQIIRCKNNTA